MSELHDAIAMANKALDERDLWKKRFEELAAKHRDERIEWVDLGEMNGRALERMEIIDEIGAMMLDKGVLFEVMKRISARDRTGCPEGVGEKNV